MANTSVFEWACGALEEATSFDRLEARGTMRLALQAAGLDARHLDASQAETVFSRVLPKELETRGIPDASAVCAALVSQLAAHEVRNESPTNESPESVFSRLGG